MVQLKLYRQRNPHSTGATPTIIGQETNPIVPAQLPCSLFQGLCFNFIFFSRFDHAIAIPIML